MMDKERKKFEADNFYNLGISFIHREFLDKAENAFQKAVELDPELAIAWAYLSKLFEKNGRYEDAEKALNRAKELDKNIDFDVIQKDCRLFEDRNIITGMFKKYQKGGMETSEFIDFVTKLSPRAIALISRNNATKRFFEIAVVRATIESVSKLEFEFLPTFLSKINFSFDEITEIIEENTVPALLTSDVSGSFLKFIEYLNNRLEGKLGEKFHHWCELSKLYHKKRPETKSLFDLATGLLTVIEKMKKMETPEEILQPLRNHTVGVIISESVSRGQDGAQYLLSAFKQSHFDIVNIIGSCMVSVLILEKKRKPILEFYGMIKEELTNVNPTKKAIARAEQWSQVLSTIDRKLSQSINEYDQIVNLLDIIEETNGEFEPTIIAEQCLRMIKKDLASEIRVQSSAYLESRVLHWYGAVGPKLITKQKMMRWLDSIKVAQ